jgi:nitroreductase
MEFYDVVRSRRSCRVFKPDAVPREVLERVVEAGAWAPSGKNRQNWRFFVLSGEKKDALVPIAERSFPAVEEDLRRLYDEKVVAFTRAFFKNLGGAPVVLVVYTEPCANGPFVDMQAGAAAVENILLAAAREGLQGCWMTAPVLLKTEIDLLLGASGMELVAVVPLGYPAKIPPTPTRRTGRVSWLGF